MTKWVCLAVICARGEQMTPKTVQIIDILFQHSAAVTFLYNFVIHSGMIHVFISFLIKMHFCNPEPANYLQEQLLYL